ncbi:MAG TPA: glycosyltransferase family 39 protein [Minicystis sp.]|nr:glycosyltransferase family 39 protein [Minicystis sp.]
MTTTHAPAPPASVPPSNASAAAPRVGPFPLPRAWTRRSTVVLALGAVAQLVLFVVAHTPKVRPLEGDENMYWRTAHTLLEGRTPKPTLVWPPLQTWVIAASVALFGDSRIPLEIGQALLFLACGVLLRQLVLRVGVSARAADVALGLFLLDPQLAAFSTYLWPEVLHLALVLVALVLLLFEGRGSDAVRTSGAGVCVGLALLAKSLFAPLVPAFALVAALTAKDRAARVQRAAWFAVGVAAMTVPVIVQHGTRYGVWTIADSGTLNAYVGLNDPSARRDYTSADGPALREYLHMPLTKRNGVLRERIVQKLRDDGVGTVFVHQLEKQYAHLFDRTSFFTDQLPGGRWSHHAPADLRGDLLGTWADVAYALNLVLAAFGLCFVDWRRDRRTLALPALFVAYQLALFLVLHVVTRYRFPILPALIAFSAVAVDRAPAAWHRGITERLRLAASTLLAAGALALAFWPVTPQRPGRGHHDAPGAASPQDDHPADDADWP